MRHYTHSTSKFPQLTTKRIFTTHNSPTPTVKMPQEVSDIKQFIEICRRQDASCKFYLPGLAGLWYDACKDFASSSHS
jgi:Ribosomal L38e protein family